jgi:hypothetical protein
MFSNLSSFRKRENSALKTERFVRPKTELTTMSEKERMNTSRNPLPINDGFTHGNGIRTTAMTPYARSHTRNILEREYKSNDLAHPSYKNHPQSLNYSLNQAKLTPTPGLIQPQVFLVLLFIL